MCTHQTMLKHNIFTIFQTMKILKISKYIQKTRENKMTYNFLKTFPISNYITDPTFQGVNIMKIHKNL